MSKHGSGCEKGCKDSHDAFDHHSKDYHGGGHGATNGGCFAADVAIKTLTGYRQISDIKVGESAVAWSPTENAFRARKVVKTTTLAPRELWEVRHAGATKPLRLTGNHRLSSTEGWIRADKLSAAAKIMWVDANGVAQWMQVLDVSASGRYEPVFNIHTAFDRTFIADGCVAHCHSVLPVLRAKMVYFLDSWRNPLPLIPAY